MAEKKKKLRAEERSGTMTDISKKLDGLMVSSAVIANVYGVTAQTIGNLKIDGIIKGEGSPTRFEFLPTISALFEYERKKRKSKATKSEDTLAKERQKLDAEVRYKEAKAESVELQLAEQKGQLHRAEDIKEIVSNNVMTIRGMLLALPGKLAVNCAEESNPMKVSAIVKKEVCAILNDLSEYDYNDEAYKERVLKRYGLTGETEEDDSE